MRVVGKRETTQGRLRPLRKKQGSEGHPKDVVPIHDVGARGKIFEEAKRKRNESVPGKGRAEPTEKAAIRSRKGEKGPGGRRSGLTQLYPERDKGRRLQTEAIKKRVPSHGLEEQKNHCSNKFVL